MKRIGILSDTHGCFDAPLREFLKDVDEIWHAGDIGSLELADEIAAFKPLKAVCGNIDGGVMRRVYDTFTYFECERVGVLMTHIGGYPRHYAPHVVERIVGCRPKLFIAGHSHILKIIYDHRRRRRYPRHGGGAVAPLISRTVRYRPFSPCSAVIRW